MVFFTIFIGLSVLSGLWWVAARYPKAILRILGNRKLKNEEEVDTSGFQSLWWSPMLFVFPLWLLAQNFEPALWSLPASVAFFIPFVISLSFHHKLKKAGAIN